MKTHCTPKFRITISMILIIIFTFSLTGCTKLPATTSTSQSGFYFDTVITLTVYESVDDRIFTEAFALCDYYEKLFSRTIEGSDIWNINHANGQPVQVNEQTIELVTKALSYAKLSNGSIDPTLAPVSDLWCFSSDSPVIPDEDMLKEACNHVDYHQIHIDSENQTISLTNPNAGLDLGFIAKGYIADRLKDFFLSKGISSALISLGGNILCVGPKPDGSPYRIGIQYPFGASNELIASVACTDISVVTSGIYERSFTINDQVYHHILNPRTGYPIQNDLLSVTILSPVSTDADALSTVCYCLGLHAGMDLIESLNNVEAIFITSDYELHYSSGADAYDF